MSETFSVQILLLVSQVLPTFLPKISPTFITDCLDIFGVKHRHFPRHFWEKYGQIVVEMYQTFTAEITVQMSMPPRTSVL